MEKFGIFNILSALGNLSEESRGEAAQTADKPAAQTDEAPPAPVGIFTGEERMNKMLGVLERHEQISKRIDKNSKTPR